MQKECGFHQFLNFKVDKAICLLAFCCHKNGLIFIINSVKIWMTNLHQDIQFRQFSKKKNHKKWFKLMGNLITIKYLNLLTTITTWLTDSGEIHWPFRIQIMDSWFIIIKYYYTFGQQKLLDYHSHVYVQQGHKHGKDQDQWLPSTEINTMWHALHKCIFNKNIKSRFICHYLYRC